MNRTANATVDARHLWLASLGTLVMARRNADAGLRSVRLQAASNLRKARALAIDAGHVARGIAMTAEEALQARLRKR